MVTTSHGGVARVDVSVTMYEDDLGELDALVDRVRSLGGRSANRNRLLRIATALLLEVPPDEIVARLATMPTARSSSR
jgi:hypothetical protein